MFGHLEIFRPSSALAAAAGDAEQGCRRREERQRAIKNSPVRGMNRKVIKP